MIPIKTQEEVKVMTQGGKILGEVVRDLIDKVNVGMSELELDELAEKLILEKGGEPGFKKVPGYKHTLCLATNNVVVHGIPGSYRFKKGDVVGIDCGVFYKGFHTDMSHSTVVGGTDDKAIKNFLSTGEKALDYAIKEAIVGNRIGNISEVIQDIVEDQRFSVVKSLIGHGVGRELHEEPEIPGYLYEDIDKTPLIKEGMTLAVEVIYNMGSDEVVYSKDDGWTIGTKDGSVSGLFERTVAVTKRGPVILTEL